MLTERLYQKNVYQKTAGATVRSAEGKDGKTIVCLDRTIFFPTGGGQSCDTGTLDGFAVSEVYEYEDDIYHVISSPDAGPALETLTAGREVALAIDWNRRFDNMQRHCGEHILSGIFFDLCGGVNRGFHMGDAYMTIDISLEEDPSITTLTWDMAEEAEARTNQVIWQNLPVVTRRFATREEAEGLPLRKRLSIDRDISIVSIGSTDHPTDCVACCGTHPSHTGQVGLLKIYKVEANKGMFRIYFEAGQRAFRHYQQHFHTLTALGRELSAGADDVLPKYLAQQQRQRDTRDRLYHLTQAEIEREAQALRLLPGEQLAIGRFSILTVEDLQDLSKRLAGSMPRLLVLVQEQEHTVLLFSEEDTISCGQLVKQYAQPWGGKGGGSPKAARAKFSDATSVEQFLTALQTALTH